MAVGQWLQAERRAPALRDAISYLRAELELCATPSLTRFPEDGYWPLTTAFQ